MDLSAYPAIDGHAHPLLTAAAAGRIPYAAFFSEGGAETDAASTLFYRRSMRDLAAFFGCQPTAEAIREQQKSIGFDAWIQRLMSAAHLEAVLVDEGYPASDDSLPLGAMGVTARRVLRLEQVAEDVLGTARTFEEFVEALRTRLEDPAVVAFKSIAAYRCGLSLWTYPGSALWFSQMTEEAHLGRRNGRPFRLEDAYTIGVVLHHALDIASRRGLPVQFHCGFGDNDLILADADPSRLGRLVAAWPRVRFVLLHNWPYARGAGWMASVYPNVWADFGLAVPFLSRHGMRMTIHELLHQAPTSRVLYSSDASQIAELYWLGATHGRRALGEVLDHSVRDGDLSASEADGVAEAILGGNARSLYKLA